MNVHDRPVCSVRDMFLYWSVAVKKAIGEIGQMKFERISIYFLLEDFMERSDNDYVVELAATLLNCPVNAIGRNMLQDVAEYRQLVMLRVSLDPGLEEFVLHVIVKPLFRQHFNRSLATFHGDNPATLADHLPDQPAVLTASSPKINDTLWLDTLYLMLENIVQ